MVSLPVTRTATPHTMSSRKRSGSGSKRPREKVVFIYELIFRGEDPRTNNPSEEFWNEFFLLQPNVDALEQELNKQTTDQLGGVKENINELFARCVDILETEHAHPKRLYNCLLTLATLLHGFFRKAAAEQGSGFDLIHTLMGFEEADERMRRLVTLCNRFLTKGAVPSDPSLLLDDADQQTVQRTNECVRDVCLKLWLMLVTGTDHVSQNVLLEYIMINNCIFEPLVNILGESQLRARHGHDVVILLTLLVNYRKYEGANPYIVQLSLLADELALNGYSQVISAALIDFCRQYATQNALENGGGGGGGQHGSSSWFSSLSNIVGNMFVSDEGVERVQQIRANNALLALYEAIHLNRNFITTLAQTQAESSAPPSPSNTLSQQQAAGGAAAAMVVGKELKASAAPILDAMTQSPTNLLVAVFQYCSIVMQDHKNESAAATLKLCLLILTCIAEDQYANALMHDVNLSFKVALHRAPMRHRKIPVDRLSKLQPLAATLLDLLLEFVVSHLMKKFPMEQYLLCVGIIHRVLCYQKRCRVRLTYPWKELWSALIGLLKFLVQQEQTLVKRCNIFHLAIQVVNIFNLYITYGDTFLATTNSYDELYYELNREEKVFSEIHAMVLRYTTMPECEYKEDVLRLLNSLVNILAIIKHFQIKIKEWLELHHISTPSEEQILDVVRKNYDLTLKLQDSLDQYERYAESPRHSAFFTTMVREVVQDTKTSVYAAVKEAASQGNSLLPVAAQINP